MPVNNHSYSITKDTSMHLKQTLNKSMYLCLAYPDVHMQLWRNSDKPKKWHSVNAVKDNDTEEAWYRGKLACEEIWFKKQVENRKAIWGFIY